MREAELEEMEKRWREENERIMREHPVAVPYVGAPETLGTPVNETPLPCAEQPQSVPDDEPGLPLPDPETHKRELP